MKRLNRSDAEPPQCLSRYKHGRDNWSAVPPEDKAEIWQELDRMQQCKCAYCEARLAEANRHIEHFKPKCTFPALTFTWENLFGCCNGQSSCGHYKDSRGKPYSVDDIIDPCIEDPDQFFHFRTDGRIDIRRDLDANQSKRANETLRVLNLDDQAGPLRKRREVVVQTYLAPDPGIVETLSTFDPEDAAEYVMSEIERIAGEEFSSPVRQLLNQFL